MELTCRVLHTKSLLSSPHTFWAATTNTSTRKTNTMDNQILPKAVEYLLTPLSRFSSPDQFILLVLWSRAHTGSHCGKEEVRKYQLTLPKPCSSLMKTCGRS
ncbi:hypothetical protein XENOCAPTIV_025695, partial [Xenoophorus captivus]